MASAQEDALSSLRADGALRTLLNLIPLLTTARAPSAAAVQPSLTFGLPAGGLAPRTSRWALARACGARLTRVGRAVCRWHGSDRAGDARVLDAGLVPPA